MIAINPNQRFECKIDDATFYLRPPKHSEQLEWGRLMAKVARSSIKTENVADLTPDQFAEAISYGEAVVAIGKQLIVGWAGIVDLDGCAVAPVLRPDNQRLTDECLDMLTVDTLIKVGKWAMENVGKPSRESVGKSVPPSA